MPLSPNDIRILKQPFGTLILDKDITEEKIRQVLKNAKQVIAVGDATTERLLSYNIIPDISVVDGKERRRKRSYPDYIAKELRCSNPKGTVSKEAMTALEEAFRTSHPARVLVDGEEDMLALPIFSMAPEGATVLYGQPLEGIVVVRIDSKVRKKAKNLMDRIGIK